MDVYPGVMRKREKVSLNVRKSLEGEVTGDMMANASKQLAILRERKINLKAARRVSPLFLQTLRLC